MLSHLSWNSVRIHDPDKRFISQQLTLHRCLRCANVVVRPVCVCVLNWTSSDVCMEGAVNREALFLFLHTHFVMLIELKRNARTNSQQLSLKSGGGGL